MQELLQNVCFPSQYKSETVQLASIAKLIRNKMFNTEEKCFATTASTGFVVI